MEGTVTISLKDYEKMKNLIECRRSYIQFLGSEVRRVASFLDTHGMSPSEATVKEGQHRRAEIDKFT